MNSAALYLLDLNKKSQLTTKRIQISFVVNFQSYDMKQDTLKCDFEKLCPKYPHTILAILALFKLANTFYLARCSSKDA